MASEDVWMDIKPLVGKKMSSVDNLVILVAADFAGSAALRFNRC